VETLLDFYLDSELKLPPLDHQLLHLEVRTQALLQMLRLHLEVPQLLVHPSLLHL
jgi:hypothetical protein